MHTHSPNSLAQDWWPRPDVWGQKLQQRALLVSLYFIFLLVSPHRICCSTAIRAVGPAVSSSEYACITARDFSPSSLFTSHYVILFLILISYRPLKYQNHDIATKIYSYLGVFRKRYTEERLSWYGREGRCTKIAINQNHSGFWCSKNFWDQRDNQINLSLHLICALIILNSWFT